MKIALIFNKELQGTVGIYFERALEALGCQFEHFWTKNSSTIKRGYDLYLRIDDGDYGHDIPQQLYPSAFYAVDTNLRHAYKMIKKQITHYDFVFCVESHAAREFSRQGINSFWVPLACDPDIHRNLNLAKRYRIAFVGNEGGIPRKFVLQELRERYPDSFIGWTPYRKMGQIYSQAKIGFHLIVPQTRNCSPMSMRFFEIPSCGTMLLANQVRKEDLEALGFADRKNIVLYKNTSEIFALIEYYLENDQEREKIAKRGHELVTTRHTYKKRMEQMLNIIKLNKSKRRIEQ